jgi:hypothetical protein
MYNITGSFSIASVWNFSKGDEGILHLDVNQSEHRCISYCIGSNIVVMSDQKETQSVDESQGGMNFKRATLTGHSARSTLSKFFHWGATESECLISVSEDRTFKSECT